MAIFKQKNIKVKIGTQDEAFWTDIKKKTEQEIVGLEKMLKFNRSLLEMCEEKIKKAKK